MLVQSCSRLRLGLDLLGVNPSNIPIKIKRSGQVLVDFIILEISASAASSVKQRVMQTLK